MSAAVASAFKPMINKIGANSPLADYRPHRVFAAAVIGGTTSVISGGKFGNGAVTGAFNQLFNGETALKKKMYDKIKSKYQRSLLKIMPTLAV
jgi:hypothetical protein